jgi:hypothetical protein
VDGQVDGERPPTTPAELEGSTRRDRLAAVSRLLGRIGSTDFLIPALIGILTLSAAFLAWRSVVHGEKATAEYRNAVLERDREETVLVRAVLDVNSGAADVAVASADIDLAQRLEARAGSLGSDDSRSAPLLEQAASLRREATERYKQLLYSIDPTYLSVDANSGLTLAADALQLDRETAYAGLFPPEPDEAAAVASSARESGEDLTKLIIALAFAGLVATIAHVVPDKRLKIGLASVGACIWIAVTTVAIVAGG